MRALGGHDPGRSALLVEIPDAERVVGDHRLRFDPVASAGVPAHVTILYPFRTPGSIDDRVRARVAEVVGGFASFEVEFHAPGTFPGMVWLRPEPEAPFRRLTSALSAAFPDCRPYGGAFPDPTPHLTVGQALTEDRAHDVAREMRTRLGTSPVICRVDHVALHASDDAGRWSRLQEFPLRATPTT